MDFFRNHKKWILSIIILGMVAIGVILYFVLSVQAKDPNIEEEERHAFNLLQTINAKNEENSYKSTIAQWDYESNITDTNLERALAISAEVAESEKQTWNQIKQFNWRSFSDYDLKRQFMLYSVLGDSALPETEYKYLKANISEMEAVYAKAKICDYQNKTKCDLALEPELTSILANSRNEEELKHVWIEWRNTVGPKCKENYKHYVNLSNQAAKLNNFENQGDYWLFNYEDPTFKDQISRLWDQLKPLYLQIHAYVRFKLREKYGDIVTEKGPIPAHLLGNMWAQTWNNIASFTLPYPNVEDVDITSEMLKQFTQ